MITEIGRPRCRLSAAAEGPHWLLREHRWGGGAETSHPTPCPRKPSSEFGCTSLSFFLWVTTSPAHLVGTEAVAVCTDRPPLSSCRDHAWPLQPGGGPDHSRLRLPGSHGGPGLLRGADQQGQEQAKAEEAQGEAPTARAAGSPTKGPLGVTSARLAVSARERLRGWPRRAGGAVGSRGPPARNAPRACAEWASPGEERRLTVCRAGRGDAGGPRGAAWSQTSPSRPRRPPVHQRLGRLLKAVGEETVLTKLDVLHKGYFLYLLLGKSHFKDLCCMEAKLFFFVNRTQFFTITS